MPCVNSTTMFPTVKRVIKKLIKNNSILVHHNDPNGCSCCGGVVRHLSLDELQEPLHDFDYLLKFEISKIYTWAFDKVKVYAIAATPEDDVDTSNIGEYACVNYLGKQFGRYFHGDVLLFKDRAHAETYTRQFRDFKEIATKLKTEV